MDGVTSNGLGARTSRSNRALGVINARAWFPVGLAVILPAAVALVGAGLIGREALRGEEIRSAQTRTEEIRTQSRLLLDTFLDEISTLKTRAEMLADGKKGTATAEAGSGILTAVRLPYRARGDALSAAVAQLSLAEVRANGWALITPIAAAGIPASWPRAWMGLAFVDGGRIYFVAFDPKQAFQGFEHWKSRRSAPGALRAYLVDVSGRVPIHSESAYSGTDFSGTEAYVRAFKPLLSDSRAGMVSWLSTYRGIDLRPVLTSAVRVGKTPYAVVIERVARSETPRILHQMLVPGALLALAVLAICLLSIFALTALSRRTQQRAWLRADAHDAAFAIWMARPMATEELSEALIVPPVRPQPPSPDA